jgi:hypothetical protein
MYWDNIIKGFSQPDTGGVEPPVEPPVEQPVEPPGSAERPGAPSEDEPTGGEDVPQGINRDDQWQIHLHLKIQLLKKSMTIEHYLHR